ncbi:uncharacterized protein [Macrobrachium rosenbergii]|uniref:uncharacterized protein n=1 Tax=Macrobrachium rosenbergii TaxID=79674 RepID=UPI0034D6E612
MWTTMLQCKLKGKAQRVYNTLSEDLASDYDTVKSVILRAYDLVPEAYRQKFRNFKKEASVTFVEFARKKEQFLDDWMKSKEADSFDKLKELILVEEFKRMVGRDLKIHLDELKLDSLQEIAIASDEYSLAHRQDCVKENNSKRFLPRNNGWRGNNRNQSDLNTYVDNSAFDRKRNKDETENVELDSEVIDKQVSDFETIVSSDDDDINFQGIDWDAKAFKEAQQNEFRVLEIDDCKDVSKPVFLKENGLIYRASRSLNVPADQVEVVRQLVIPEKYRSVPARGKPNQKIPKAPLIPVPSVGEPFGEIVIDVVGPLPWTRGGNEYLLTMVDRVTRFPEAIPLRSIRSEKIVEALVSFFTKFGIPKTLQSDCGTNFMSRFFRKKMSELGVHHVTSSPYHPESQGQVEWFHQTLKSVIKKFCIETGNEWDKEVPFALFAIHSVPNETLGFSPFDLVFGHSVHGPLDVVREHWEGEAPEVNVLDYVSGLQGKLRKAWALAQQNLFRSQAVMKANYDVGTKVRVFKPGDRVLVLLPLPGNPLKAQFSGPWKEAPGRTTILEHDVDIGDSSLLNNVHIGFIQKRNIVQEEIGLSPRARQISAFVTGDGLYECKVMPFGMKNAAATFQRLMNRITQELEGCIVYIDDLIIFSDDWETHLKRLEALFQALRKAGLVVNLKKSDFAQAKVIYLGHEVGMGKVAPKRANVEAVTDFPAPQNRRGVRRFLGMVGYYRRFIKSFSEIATPLTNLLRKNVKFVWTKECQEAFGKLKAVLISYPLLQSPNFDLPFRLATDASDVGLGDVLLQEDDSGMFSRSVLFKKIVTGRDEIFHDRKRALCLIKALTHFFSIVLHFTQL